MSIMKVSDLTFCYEGSYDNIFENVSFQLDTDWRLGLTGRNGNHAAAALRKYIPSISTKGAAFLRRLFSIPYNLRICSSILTRMGVKNGYDFCLIYLQRRSQS